MQHHILKPKPALNKAYLRLKTSRNEGESEAKVWPLHQLNVKGEGESGMYYRGIPAVSKDLKGNAQLIDLPR
ncbi:hypothetical protein [Pontibacter populi]|uniref:Uncharacterized protein n=1 Tax=Pontibacter populi TaxID=890055 RepID=A0ABV1RY83_9BACT